MGQVVGASDNHATRAITTPYRPPHMMATIMHSLFDIGELRLAQNLPSNLKDTITEGQPIRELI